MLPTIWFRNTWSWGLMCAARECARANRAPVGAVEFDHEYYGRRRFLCDGAPDLLFTENETNTRRLYGDSDGARYVGRRDQ